MLRSMHYKQAYLTAGFTPCVRRGDDYSYILINHEISIKLYQITPFLGLLLAGVLEPAFSLAQAYLC